MNGALAYFSGYFERENLVEDVFPVSGDFEAWLAETYRARQRHYSQYALPAKNKPLKGTLFWEYGKYICYSMGIVNPLSITKRASQAQSWFEMAVGIAKTL
jgi:hypothetical protein